MSRLLDLLSPRKRAEVLEGQALEAIARAENVVRENAATLKAQKTEIARLEGLLDVAGDPDAALAGVSNQGLYRSIVGNREEGSRDFNDLKRNEMLRLSHGAYALRGDGHNILETILDFIWGDDGLAPKVKEGKDEALQKRLDEIWDHPRNRLAGRCPAMILALLIEGEKYLTAEWNPTDGGLLLGRLFPENVERMEQDEQGRDLWVWARLPGQTIPRGFFVLDALTANVTITPLAGDKEGARYLITETSIDNAGGMKIVSRRAWGLTFAWFLGRPDGATRGRPVLGQSLDYIDLHDGHLWSTVEREKHLKDFLIDVAAEGVTDKASAQAKLKELGLDKPPSGPTMLCHSPGVTVQVMQPEFSSSAFETVERILEVSIYGAHGMPEHWRGSGGDSNLATAQAQEAQPLRRLRRIQGEVIGCLTRLIQVQLDLQARALTGDQVDPQTWSMAKTEIGGKDKQRGMDVLQKLSASLATAVSQNAISRELMNKVLVQALREYGFDVPDDLAELPEENQGGLDDLLKRAGLPWGTRAGPARDKDQDREPRGGKANA